MIAFTRRYQGLTGNDPDRLAVVGYDVARFLAESLQTMRPGATGSDLRRTIAAAPAYEGLGTRILFQGGQVNRSLFYHRFQDGRATLMR